MLISGKKIKKNANYRRFFSFFNSHYGTRPLWNLWRIRSHQLFELAIEPLTDALDFLESARTWAEKKRVSLHMLAIGHWPLAIGH